jgi:hypothetical protein
MILQFFNTQRSDELVLDSIEITEIFFFIIFKEIFLKPPGLWNIRMINDQDFTVVNY